MFLKTEFLRFCARISATLLARQMHVFWFTWKRNTDISKSWQLSVSMVAPACSSITGVREYSLVGMSTSAALHDSWVYRELLGAVLLALDSCCCTNCKAGGYPMEPTDLQLILFFAASGSCFVQSCVLCYMKSFLFRKVICSEHLLGVCCVI